MTGCGARQEWSAGAFDDARLNLVIGDAKQYLEASRDQYDVIIMDISDPIEAGPGWVLYAKEFYETTARQRLAPGGVFVTQSGSGFMLNADKTFTILVRAAAQHAVAGR